MEKEKTTKETALTKDEKDVIKKADNLTKENKKQNEKQIEKQNDKKVEKQNEKQNEKQIEKQIENQNPKYEIVEKKSNVKSVVIGISVSLVILILIALFCTIFSFLNMNNQKIMKNISIMGIDIQDLTKEEAVNKIKKATEERLTTDLVFKHNEQTVNLIPKEIEFSYDIEQNVENAYQIGRKDNIFLNNFEILSLYLNKKNIKPTVSFNQELYSNIEDQINEYLTDGVRNPHGTIEGNKLIINKGTDGVRVDMEELKNLIINKMISDNYNTDVMEMPVYFGKCNEIDIDKIYKEIYKEPVDASFTKEPFKIIASQNGLDFDCTLDEAKALITGDKESYEIPLKTLYPKVTIDQISNEAFPDELASYSTNYSSSSYNRANNVELAAKKINGIVLMPGEEFSYNQRVGKRTSAAGFREAGAYAGGKVVNTVGGGICQVSSTLYNAVLRANLEVLDRSNHMFAVGYVPIGTDATVSWGAPDFKFKNNRSYPIKIVTSTSKRNVYIKILGLKEEGDYEVQIISYRTGTIPYKTTYTKDESLQPGETKVIQKGSNGARSVTYKVLKKNGKEESRILVSKDVYDPHNEIIAIGE